MPQTVALAYGVIAYAFFFVTFCYAIGFVEDTIVPKGIDDGAAGPVGPSIAVNVVLLGLFGLQHSIMARPRFKDWWCRFVPRPIERSTFVLLATAILALLMWQWRPLPAIVWDAQIPALRTVLYAVSLGGWLLVLYATFVIDHFDLFGLRQVWLHFRGIEYRHPPFMERSVYRLVRHPLMAGFIIAFWSAPTMTQGRLLFAIVTTAYILVAIQIEERDLMSILGDSYRDYHRRTPMLIPLGRRSGTS
jgi:protein-S-isoprenylcysteine O-methyltransferase Ste14